MTMRLHQWMLDRAIDEIDDRWGDGEIDDTERAAQIERVSESFESAVETQAEEIVAEGGRL